MTASWFPAAVFRIAKLARLRQNWDGSDSMALRVDEVVMPVVQFLLDHQEAIVMRPYISLTDSGGLEVEWDGLKAYLAVSFEGPTDIMVCFQAGDEEEREGNLSTWTDLDDYLRRAAQ